MTRDVAHKLGMTAGAFSELKDACSPLSYASLAEDASQSTTSLATVPDFGLELEAGTLYRFEFFVRFQTAASTTGIALGIDGPADPEFVVYRTQIQIGTASETLQIRRAYNVASAGTSVDQAEENCFGTIFGLIKTTEAGTLVLRYRSEIADSVVTVKSGSCGFLYRL